jgi:hypothetical protein
MCLSSRSEWQFGSLDLSHVAILVYWLIGVLIGVTVNGAVGAAVVAVSCLGVTCLRVGSTVPLLMPPFGARGS